MAVNTLESPVALLMQGQGSQQPGMFDELKQTDAGGELDSLAQMVLGESLYTDVMHGDADRLRQTEVAQPAIVLAELMLLRSKVLVPRHNFHAGAGHSLGEISMLAAAEVFTDEEALKMAAVRGAAMADAARENPGGMMIVRKMSLEQIGQILDEISSRHPGIALGVGNVNSPKQIILSGGLEGLEALERFVTGTDNEENLKRLENVGGAFHSDCMRSATATFTSHLESVHFNNFKVPVYQGIDGLAFNDPAAIKQRLVDGLLGTVRWDRVIKNMIDDGHTKFVELGPGKKTLGVFVAAIANNMDRSIDANTIMSTEL